MGYCIFLRKGETHAVPSAGILASDLAVGDIVKLTESGSPVEYIVVNQGIPTGGESLYDDSCNGTWLLRKDVYSQRVWDSSNINTYDDSAINTWLNGDFFNSLGNVEQSTIKQIKIPYCTGGGNTTINSGANGLSTKILLLGGYEVGFTTNDSSYIPVDGAKLGYFATGVGGNSKRIAYLNGVVTIWWLRSPYTTRTNHVWVVGGASGQVNNGRYDASDSLGIRPALILSSTAKFDKDTKILKG